jgi:hypothetical protein
MVEKMHRLLHALWTKAVGCMGYDKEDWLRLESRLEAEDALAREILDEHRQTYPFGNCGGCEPPQEGGPSWPCDAVRLAKLVLGEE